MKDHILVILSHIVKETNIRRNYKLLSLLDCICALMSWQPDAAGYVQQELLHRENDSLTQIHQLLHPTWNSNFFSQFASLIRGSLEATQLFSPNPLSSLRIVRVEMLLLSLSNMSVSSIVVFYDLIPPNV